MKLPAWWPWVSRKRYELTDVARRSAAYDAHMARGALREAERERTEARAEVERLREAIRETWRRFDSANDAITDRLIWLDAEMRGWSDEG